MKLELTRDGFPGTDANGVPLNPNLNLAIRGRLDLEKLSLRDLIQLGALMERFYHPDALDSIINNLPTKPLS